VGISRRKRFRQRQKQRSRQSQLKKRHPATLAGEMLRTPAIQPLVPSPHRRRDPGYPDCQDLPEISKTRRTMLRPTVLSATKWRWARAWSAVFRHAPTRMLSKIAFHDGPAARLRSFCGLCELGAMPHCAPFPARRLHRLRRISPPRFAGMRAGQRH
jgi:hypothetical protein